MASKKSFVDFVAEQLRDAGTISSRRMFGEYGLYCNGVFFSVICGNQFFVKITPEGEEVFPHLPKTPPHEGAKQWFLVEDLEEREMLTKLVEITCRSLSQGRKPSF